MTTLGAIAISVIVIGAVVLMMADWIAQEVRRRLDD